jgi:2-iminobutanoate/2-iminopropanoate deaminase
MSSRVYTIIDTPEAPKAVGTYSQGVRFQDTYFFSGQIGLCPKTMQMKEGFEEQLKQILSNIDALLTASQLTRQHILKTTIFMTDLSKFPIVNDYYTHFFTAPYPARSCVEVPRLPRDAQIEIEVIAVAGNP